MVTTSELGEEIVVKATGKQVSAVLDGEAVILQLENGVYFGLNSVGTHVWTLLQSRPHTLRDLSNSILETFDTDVETCLKDLRVFLATLEKKQLIEIRKSTHA